MENLLDILLQKGSLQEGSRCYRYKTIGNIRDKENLYISKKLFNKVSKYLEKSTSGYSVQ